MGTTLSKLLSGFALAILLTSASAAAEQPFYAGFALGQATDDDLDESDVAWRVYGGYQITDTWGVEAGYASFGEPSVAGVELEYGGFGLYGTGRWPINEQFDVFGKVGYFLWSVDARFLGVEVSDDGGDLAAGVGASMTFKERFRAEALYERFLGIGNSDVGMLSVGVVYEF
ncbi:MAG: outer membrane beta-barrel protein [Gammaproteobacteria bacterium]